MNQQELKRKAQKLINEEYGFAPRLKNIVIIDICDDGEDIFLKIGKVRYRICYGIVYRIYAESED